MVYRSSEQTTYLNQQPVLSVSYNSLVKRRRVVIVYSTLFNTSSNLIFFGGGEGFCNGVPNQIVPTVYSSDEENPTASANRSSKFTAPLSCIFYI